MIMLPHFLSQSHMSHIKSLIVTFPAGRCTILIALGLTKQDFCVVREGISSVSCVKRMILLCKTQEASFAENKESNESDALSGTGSRVPL